MPALKTEEEKKKIREAALATLAEHKDELEKFKTQIEGQDEEWQKEIDLLKRQVKTHIVKVPIGDKEGETLSIRGSLSDYEMIEITKLDNIRKELNLKEDLETITQITHVMLSVILANPIMTVDWLATHQTEYSTEAMLKAYLTYQEDMVTRAERVAKIQKFR